MKLETLYFLQYKSLCVAINLLYWFKKNLTGETYVNVCHWGWITEKVCMLVFQGSWVIRNGKLTNVSFVPELEISPVIYEPLLSSVQ